MRSTAIFVILAATLLGACHPTSRGGGSSSSSPVVPVSLKQADVQVSCQENQPCPDSIALIRSIVNNQIQSCPGTLIGEDTLLTSSSCVPTTCDGNIMAVFPKTSMSAQTTLKCSQVAVDGGVAFIRLERGVLRPVLSVDRAGIKSQKTVFVYTVNAEKENDFKLQTSQCYYDSSHQALLQKSTGASAVYLSTEGCTLKELRPGSVIVSPESRIIGVVGKASHDAGLEKMMMVINSSCLKLPGDPETVCSPQGSVSEAALAKPVKSLDRQFIEIISQWRLSLPTAVIARVDQVRTGNRLDLKADIVCLKPRSSWGQDAVIKAIPAKRSGDPVTEQLTVSIPTSNYEFKGGEIVLSETKREVHFDLSNTAGNPRECTSTELTEDLNLQKRYRQQLQN